MSLEHRQILSNGGQPNLAFQAAFGFYLGLIISGIVVLIGLLAGVTTTTLLTTVPTSMTAVILISHIVSKRLHGLPERIGHRRRLRLACYLPVVGFTVAAVAASVMSFGYSMQYLVLTILFIIVLGIVGFGFERLCRKQFIETVTVDEPNATWTYQPMGLFPWGNAWGPTVLLLITIIGVIVMIIVTESVVGLFSLAFFVIMIIGSWILSKNDSNGKKYYGKRFSLEINSSPNTEQGKLHAHKLGLRHEQGRSQKFIFWEQISDIDLTNDELVIKRWPRNIRCNRSAIDEPEVVYKSLIETQNRAEERNLATETR